ncbi:MAG: putative adhesin, partial [Bacteroidota bacterium]
MKRILLTFLVLVGLNSFSQPIVVNTTTYTVPQLVNDVLFAAPPGGGGASCVGTISNISWSTGTDFGATNGIGYFTNTNPNFPLTSGVILSSGDVTQAPGPNLTTQGNGVWPGDTDLFNYIDGLGIDPGLTDYNDATVLEFDFTPLTNTMSFEFLFASEEYGTFQCDYSDSFAFFLTNVTAGTAPTNLALIPSTTTPISVVTIRDNTYNASCGSVNPTYFGNYNGGANANTAATNFNGETIKMTANSSVIPNNVYHIKLVVADRNDNSYDSAVFLGGGSFNIGSPELAGEVGTSYDGLTDFTGPNAVCGSSTVTVQAGSVAISGVAYSWSLDGTPIPGANSFTYTMDQEGDYCVTLTYPGGCTQTDCIVVEHIPSLILGTPTTLAECGAGSAIFNLTSNQAAILNGMTNTISYYHSLIDAQQLFAPITNITNYPGTNGEIIYVAVEDDTTGCITTTQFQLTVDPTLCITPPIPGSPPDLYEYETTVNAGTAFFDFTPQTPIIYGSNNPADFTVTYYASSADAILGNNPITNISAFPNTINPQTIYARLQDNADPTNYATTSFNLIVVALPTVSIASNVTAVCNGQTATITFTGTAGAIIDYTVNGNPAQITLNGIGTNQFVTPALSGVTVYNLVSATITTAAGTVTQPETGSVTISITAPPTVTTPTPYVVCDDNNDGNSCLFILTTKDNEITTAPNVVAYYETPTDAQTGALPSLTSPYCNNAINQLFVRVYDPAAPGCYATTSLQLVVNPTPQANPVISDYALCDYTTPGDNVEQFTLHSKDVEIANGQTNVTITYYLTQPDAIAQNAAAVLPNLYTSGSQTIWINIKNNTTGCNSVSSFNLVVNPLPVVYVPPTIVQCSNGVSTQAVFDLTVNHDAVTGALPGLTVTYYHSLLDAQNDNSPISAPATYTGTHNEIVYIRVENDNTGCYSTTTQLLQVTQGPLAITPLPLHYCDPNNDGFGVFDLDSVKAQIQGGTVDPLVTIGF